MRCMDRERLTAAFSKTVANLVEALAEAERKPLHDVLLDLMYAGVAHQNRAIDERLRLGETPDQSLSVTIDNYDDHRFDSLKVRLGVYTKSDFFRAAVLIGLAKRLEDEAEDKAVAAIEQA